MNTFLRFRIVPTVLILAVVLGPMAMPAAQTANASGEAGPARVAAAASTNLACNLTKYASNPVLPVGATSAWDSSGVSDPSVLKDSGYKMWYSGYNDSTTAIGYATSTDGLSWSKHGTAAVLAPTSGEWDENRVTAPTVISDTDVNLYKMWYTGVDSGDVSRIGYATSPDGIVWTKDLNNPVLDLGTSGTWDDEAVRDPTVIKDGSTYHMWYVGSDSVTLRIGHATSSDGITWVKDSLNPVLDIGAEGSWEWIDVYSPSVTKIGSEYQLWYSGDALPPASVTGLATSTDGSHWTRAGIVIPEGSSASDFDPYSADYPSVIVDGATYKIWYSGYGNNGYAIGYATANVCTLGSHQVYLPCVLRTSSVSTCPAYYSDNFSNSYSGWLTDDNSDRRFAYVNGQYQIWVKAFDQHWIVTPGAKAVNFTAAVSAKRNSGSTGGYGLDFGINEDWSQYYEIEIYSNSYAIFLYNSGWTTLKDWTASSAIATGTGSNRIKVIRSGANITLYINNHFMTTVSNSTLTGLGRVGLMASSDSSEAIDVRYDDFAMYPASCGVSAAGVDFEMGKPEVYQAPPQPNLPPSE